MFVPPLAFLFGNGIGIAWALSAARHRDRRGEGRLDALWIGVWWLVAATFGGGAVALAIAVFLRGDA